MASLPAEIQESPTVRAIYASYEAKAEGPRNYLGASIIGKPCARALWYDFRWAGREQFSGRMLRLFDTGHLEEIRLIKDLRAIGVTVHETAEDGQQFGVSAIAGHFKGHMDGVALGIPEAPKTWHLLEFKTHGAKSFATLKKGVREAKPEHFAQMQIYMHLAGLDRALYLAKNKDTDELYAERVNYDKTEAERLLARAKEIIEAPRPPEKISDSADVFACKFCHHKERCHGTGEKALPVAVNCRTCCHSTPVTDGGWDCGLWRCDKHGGKALSEAEQHAACPDHLFIPDFITFAEMTDGDEAAGSIEYRTAKGTPFINGKGRGQYRSVELAQLPAGAIESLTVRTFKETIGATVVGEDEIG